MDITLYYREKGNKEPFILTTLTIMKNGEHWFHTEEQMKFLDSWIKLFA